MNRKPKPTMPKLASPSHWINHHADKPKPSNQPVLPSTTTFPTQTLPFRASIDPKRRESTKKKREKKLKEMRGKEKNRVYILSGPSRRNVIFIRIQSKYKVYSSFLFVKSYSTLCKKNLEIESGFTLLLELLSLSYSLFVEIDSSFTLLAGVALIHLFIQSKLPHTSLIYWEILNM